MNNFKWLNAMLAGLVVFLATNGTAILELPYFEENPVYAGYMGLAIGLVTRFYKNGNETKDKEEDDSIP